MRVEERGWGGKGAKCWNVSHATEMDARVMSLKKLCDVTTLHSYTSSVERGFYFCTQLSTCRIFVNSCPDDRRDRPTVHPKYRWRLESKKWGVENLLLWNDPFPFADANRAAAISIHRSSCELTTSDHVRRCIVGKLDSHRTRFYL